MYAILGAALEGNRRFTAEDAHDRLRKREDFESRVSTISPPRHLESESYMMYGIYDKGGVLEYFY